MGIRKGQGYNVPKPKRMCCPECGKKGVKQWYVNSLGIWRDCQYCLHTWGELSWAIAMDSRKGTSQEAQPNVNDTINLHSQAHPHWSQTVEWRAGRFDPMSNAPTKGYPILHVRGRDKDGKLLEPMHFADGGGEEQPPFRGWFMPYGDRTSGFYEVRPVEWQPLRAEPQGSRDD